MVLDTIVKELWAVLQETPMLRNILVGIDKIDNRIVVYTNAEVSPGMLDMMWKGFYIDVKNVGSMSHMSAP